MNSDAVTEADNRHARLARTVGPLIAGFLVVLVGYSGPLLIVRVAVANAGLANVVADSWIFAVSVGSGLAGLILSVWLRQPIIVAFSTPGAVLLSTSLQNYRFSDAIGAYLLVAAACVVIGITGSFSKLLARVPSGIVSAMLAGVLFNFGTGYFRALPGDPERWRITVMVVIMGGVYFSMRARGSRLTIVWTSASGVVSALLLGLGTGTQAHVRLATLQWTAPTFHLGALTGLGLPLLALALSSQYAPGYAVMREAGYKPDMNRILAVTGGLGLLLAPLGGPGLNLAAITAGLATGPDAHPDEHERWKAGVVTGAVYVMAGIFGVSLLSVFSVVPKEFVAAIMGLALFGTISSSAASALADPAHRDAAAVTLLCAAGGFTLFHVGAPFWALVAGLAVDALVRRLRPA